MQLFSADATIFKKKNLTFIFAPENMKKTPSKVAHNWPRPFFFSTGLAAQTAQKQKSRTTKSPLMQDWVFRLGSPCNKPYLCRPRQNSIKESNSTGRHFFSLSLFFFQSMRRDHYCSQ